MGILKEQIKTAYQNHFTIDDAQKLDDFAQALEDAIKAGLSADMKVTTVVTGGSSAGSYIGATTWNS